MSHPQAQLQQARQAFNGGYYRQAARLLSPLLRQNPNNAEIIARLGYCEVQDGVIEPGIRKLEKACRLMPNNAELHRWLAIAHSIGGAVDEALGAIDAALRLRPGHASFLGTKADFLSLKGEFERALEVLEPLREQGSLDASALTAYARCCRALRMPERAIDLVRSHVAAPGMRQNDRASALFLLGSLLDAAREYDQAWQAYSSANRLLGSRFDPDDYARRIDALCAAWTRDVIGTLPRAETRSELPILVVGMPRSGTTLVDQIIDSHPDAFGAGELPDMRNLVASLIGESGSGTPLVTDPAALDPAAIERAGDAYLAKLRELAPAAVRVSDKYPDNFMTLGVASLMLPAARVIHCLRDPIDTCLSCYFQNFGVGLYLNDLAHVGRRYVEYRRLMDHWKAVLELPVLSMQYEDLVGDQEVETRRILDHAGLPWSDACLRFHENDRVVITASNQQVRRPLYASSVQRWRNYERYLGPLIDALGPLAEA